MNVYEIEPIPLPDLGKAILKTFGEHEKNLEGYTENSLYSDGDKVPHQLVKVFKNRRPEVFINIDKKALQKCSTKILNGYE